MGAIRDNEIPRINRSLISLKIVVFFVCSGLTALHILHATKPLLLGLNFSEYRFITILSPFVSILGPLAVGPLADRLAAKNASTFGRSLRILTAIVLLVSAFIYAYLFAVPDVHREEARRPLVSFACDSNGAIIFQERCSEEATCHHWKEKTGSVNLTKCSYTCQNPTQFENLYTPWLEGSSLPSTEVSSEYDYEDESGGVMENLKRRRRRRTTREKKSSQDDGGEHFSDEQQQNHRQRREVRRIVRDTIIPRKVYVKPPHLCMTEMDGNGELKVTKCHIYTDDTSNIVVHSILRSATNIENDTHSAEWCNYPLDGFQCNVPAAQASWMIALKNSSRCKPMIECEVIEPYDSPDSVLADSQCIRTTGDLDVTLGGYYTIRLLGDIFAMAALTLLNTAIVIAVRETSEGRGEVCRQYAWGVIGFVLLFSPLDAFFFREEGTDNSASTVALILVIVCFILAAFVLLISTNMPLSPPEWWWHTKTGMLVYPMSAIRRYSPEILVLTLISILFGTFWSSIHSYLKWTFTDYYATTYTGIILVCILFFNVDKFIEYCGHSNIFIGGFAIFIIRFTALSATGGGISDTQWLTVVMETIEPLVITLVWITIIIYMRHVMPRKLTATGQALGVVAFFGIGKGCGALIGLARDHKYPNIEAQCIHQWLAIASSIVALIYFIVYNLVLAPRCTARPYLADNISGSASQTFNGTNGTNGSAGAILNGNGNYSPLRVYHNERGKKGQFRY